MGDGGSVVRVSEGHDDEGGRRGSGSVSSAADVLGKSVVHGMRGVGVVCEMCIYLARDIVGGERDKCIRGLGLRFIKHVGNRVSVGRVYVFEVRWCGWCRWEAGLELGQVLEGWCGVMSVLVVSICVGGRSRYLYIMLSGYMRI